MSVPDYKRDGYPDYHRGRLAIPDPIGGKVAGPSRPELQRIVSGEEA